MAHDFLLEIGTEELPPTSLKELSDALTHHVCHGLKKIDIAFDGVQSFATPRRLALLINDLQETTPIRDVTLWGPPAKIAFDADGKPTKAAEAFAKKNGIALEDLSMQHDGKQDKLACHIQSGGVKTKELLGNM